MRHFDTTWSFYLERITSWSQPFTSLSALVFKHYYPEALVDELSLWILKAHIHNFCFIKGHGGWNFPSCFTKADVKLEPGGKRELNTFIYLVFLLVWLLRHSAPWGMQELTNIRFIRTLKWTKDIWWAHGKTILKVTEWNFY